MFCVIIAKKTKWRKKRFPRIICCVFFLINIIWIDFGIVRNWKITIIYKKNVETNKWRCLICEWSGKSSGMNVRWWKRILVSKLVSDTSFKYTLIHTTYSFQLLPIYFCYFLVFESFFHQKSAGSGFSINVFCQFGVTFSHKVLVCGFFFAENWSSLLLFCICIT